ncbi:MAG TPA: hypothetical protein VF783_12865 [Terriglobales bacterium]
MRSTIGKAFWALSAVVMMLSVFRLSAIAQDPGSAASPLIGTWQVKVTLVNCQTGDPLGPPPFSSVLTFARGGTLAEDTTNPSFAPGQRGAGQGVWETTSHNVFYARSVAFINLSTPAFQAGQQIIEQIITYDDRSDQWSAGAAIKFTDTSSTVYRQGCATATATRF